MSTDDGINSTTNVVPFNENEMSTTVTPSVDIQASTAAEKQSPSSDNVHAHSLPLINANQHPKNHGDESVPSESTGERISTTHSEKSVTTTTGTTMKQCRTISLGDDESSPAPKKLKHTGTYSNVTTYPKDCFIQRDLPLIAPRLLNTSAITLLANPKDKLVLSDLHVFVRQQIEVFTATEADITQPAPGRKHRIQLHQVGLRCIHCRNLPSRDRVKRAVCYPSSIARVYHSVSDMKFDHFTHCKGRSPEICAMFQSLKEQKQTKKSAKLVNHTSSSSTAQYYHDTALEMGMLDGPGGLFMMTTKNVGATSSPEAQVMNEMSHSSSPSAAQPYHVAKKFKHAMHFMETTYEQQEPTVANTVMQHQLPPLNGPMQSNSLILLASPQDKLVLSQLHVFVRQQIEVFTATESEITQPAPGRKIRVVLGQVGLRCIHCANIPIKDRVKRAVCYPAAISGIYHAVSNMKFDHFNKCRALPAKERDIFVSLRSSCGRHGPRNSGSNFSSNSTAQYYHDSAIALGLIDSDNGIRFRDLSGSPRPHIPTGPLQTPLSMKSCNLSNESKCSTDGISALMIAAQQQQKMKIVTE
jgi:hypothetical protein